MFRITYYLLLICLITCGYLYITVSSQKFNSKRKFHDARLFSNKDINKIASLYNESYFHEALSNILIPRVVGTVGHETVKQYIINELKSLDWDVEEDQFSAETPIFGYLTFSNIIGRFNPNAERYLTLSCHYDSKYYVNTRFDAATDSAVPCSIMLQIARSLHPILKASSYNSDVSLKLIFFDGEEAFKDWNREDSLYGSRNLASKWERSAYPTKGTNSATILDSIDVLVLLDLLGTKDAKFYSFFQDTQRWHMLLSSIEKKLKVMGHIPAKEPLHFLEKSTISSIDDDHVPFMIRGVPILHVIPLPFPREWHTPDDNYSALHFPTITTLNKIFQVFTLSYLDGSHPGSNRKIDVSLFVHNN